MNRNHLYVLWTNDNPVTAEKMVFMYTVNSLVHSWWDKVTLIIWGAPAKLVAEDPTIQQKVREAVLNLGVTEALKKQNIEVKYWGVPLTEILKNNEALITI